MSGKSKKHLVLDLDQTLIAAETPEDFKKFSDGIKKQNSAYHRHDMDTDFFVFERPHLQDFLTYIFANFTVSVWTAASKNYALFIIKNIILKTKDENGNDYQPRNLNYIFFSYHCSLSKQKYGKKKDKKDKKKRKDEIMHTKNLKIMSSYFNIQNDEDHKNTIIFDDYNEVYNTQPDNCIIAAPFEVDKIRDDGDFLLGITEQLKQLLNNKITIHDINDQTIQKYKLKTHTLK